MQMRSVVALLLILAAGSASAANSGKRIIDSWNRRMQETVSLLKQDKHRAALSLADRTVNEMIGALGSGKEAQAAFGLALVHKALAHAGLGERDKAIWYWQTVVSLYPQLANDDLSMFGAAGQLLKSNTTRPAGDSSVADLKGEKTPPKVRKRVEPVYPAGARSLGVSGPLSVEVVINPDGTLHSPRIVTPLSAPTLSYVVLDAIRQWRFEPGKIGGKAVPVVFTLTVNFNP